MPIFTVCYLLAYPKDRPTKGRPPHFGRQGGKNTKKRLEKGPWSFFLYVLETHTFNLLRLETFEESLLSLELKVRVYKTPPAEDRRSSAGVKY